MRATRSLVRPVLLLRRIAAWVGVGALTVLSPVAVPDAHSEPVAYQVVFSEQALRFLRLQHRSFGTEFLGCMIGEIQSGVAVVERIAPADVEPARSTRTSVVPKNTCERAGWTGTVGMVHTHPTGERCWYFFPTTRVMTADGVSFVRGPYPVDAIMCGDHVVWVSRNLVEQRVVLVRRKQLGGSILSGHRLKR